ncbi:hypothetical protein ACWEQ2_31780 [Streptomyces sp. NPDC004096]
MESRPSGSGDGGGTELNDAVMAIWAKFGELTIKSPVLRPRLIDPLNAYEGPGRTLRPERTRPVGPQ